MANLIKFPVRAYIKQKLWTVQRLQEAETLYDHYREQYLITGSKHDKTFAGLFFTAMLELDAEYIALGGCR